MSEKCQKLFLDNKTVGSFPYVKNQYQDENENILKSVHLSLAAVCVSRFQLLKHVFLQHVLRIFNEKVVATLKLKEAY